MENTEPIVISDSDDQEKDSDEMNIEDILSKNDMTWVFTTIFFILFGTDYNLKCNEDIQDIRWT